jgi:hypothetical protein
MDHSSLNRRVICNLRGETPQKDLCAVADALANTNEILDHNGRLIQLQNGKLVPITMDVLREIISTHIVSMQLVNRGTAHEPNWTLEYPPFKPPTERALQTLLRAEKKEEGSLTARVPKV